MAQIKKPATFVQSPQAVLTFCPDVLVGFWVGVAFLDHNPRGGGIRRSGG